MPPQKKPTSGSWRSVALSILLHGAIVAAAVYGWFTWKHRPPEPETMAIQGSVVDERALTGISPPPKPAPVREPEPQPEPEPEPQPEPEPPPPEEQGPPKPDPEEVKQREEQERLAQELKLKEEAERVEQQKIEEQKQAAAKAAAEKAAAEKAAAEKRAVEKKRAEEAAAKKAAEEKARLAREQEELRRSLEAEERANAARGSEEASRWHGQIVARISRAWIRPPTAVAGVTCIVLVKQVPGGEITNVTVRGCQPNDDALRQSVENAVYAASPLPPPPAGVPFERDLELTFAPQ
jgi:colicin import membrane protein